MIRGLIAKKIGMTHIFDGEGQIISLTALECGPCFVTQIKSADKDGYDAIQLGFSQTKRLNSARKGHLAGKEVGELKYLREFDADDLSTIKIGQKLNVDLFKEGDYVNIVGTSKGKGFQGGVRRHHFHGGPKTHGQSDRTRAPGAVGSTTDPGRVLKGTRMAGHMGNRRITERNLKVIRIDPARNMVFVEGAVPGGRGGIMLIEKSTKVAKVVKPVKAGTTANTGKTATTANTGKAGTSANTGS